MNSLRPLILITPCIMPRLLWTCLRISYPRSYHAIIPTKVKNKIIESIFQKCHDISQSHTDSDS
jgi:hypothetical protein